ncbi:hypothetical protein LG634_08775 [Streptomyces bambusae]|uniref:FlgD immunoglobulin-like domain containing protein n=1 Tax=Streptomyces bambusae TaxID=1550616 RepID=UPI001CFE703D|nr:FlgD immunoglobulin-like domain containing protein [Streptomyces bambusae]MCB5164921.1 hypothetical protein [Streptomyces bambusae]
MYWSCGAAGPAGVFNRDSGTSTAAPAGDVLLGDGFTVRHDHQAKTLVLTDATTGAGRVIATGMPDKGLEVDRRFRWAVDEFTNLVAWVDEQEKVHVRSAGITPSPLSLPAGFFPGEIHIGYGPAEWDLRLSRPVTSWSLTIRSVTGTKLRTFSGGATPGQINVEWDGKTSDGRTAPSGGYTWTLKAVPYGTSTAVTVYSLTDRIYGGAAALRDYGSTNQGSPDGIGDAVALTSDNGLRTIYGDHKATGKFVGTKTSRAWPAGIRPIPMGDMSGDRCNDMLVRFANGQLRRFTPGCGTPASPDDSNLLIGAGWNEYDVLTSPGDVTGDGRGDLIARNPATGVLYLYTQTTRGIFAPGYRSQARIRATRRSSARATSTGTATETCSCTAPPTSCGG